jgi:hypothetical protein
MLAELVPAGTMDFTLAERIVSLSWRLKRAERLQNEVFDYLLAKEIEDCLDDYDEEMSPEEVEEVQNDVERDPSLAVGRATMRDYSNHKVLDRLMMHEQRIEGCLYKTMAELRKVRLTPMRQATDPTPARPETMPDSAKQTQFSAADGRQSPPCTKDDVSCETKPIESAGVVCSVPVRASRSTGILPVILNHGRDAHATETPYGVTTSGVCSRSDNGLPCETNPICGTLPMEEPPMQPLPAGA